jgi:flagellar basal body-associated protein FliL
VAGLAPAFPDGRRGGPAPLPTNDNPQKRDFFSFCGWKNLTYRQPTIKVNPRRFRKLLLFLAVPLLLLVAGGYLYLHRHVKPAPLPETTYGMQAVTVNLAGYGEHFMRVKPVLVFPAPLKPQVQAEQYKIIDRVITLLRADSYGRVMAPGGQQLAQGQVARAAAAVVPGVKRAYFTQFLID